MTNKDIIYKKQIVCLDEPIRLDKYVSQTYPDLSRHYVTELIELSYILINGQKVKKKYLVQSNDELSIHVPEPIEIEIMPENIPIDILYEDEHLVVVNKAKGMVVHPSLGHDHHTLVNALLYHCHDLSGINGKHRPGIVHRIDKNTTGILVVAKSDLAHHSLSQQFKEHTIERYYKALVFDQMEENAGRIEAPIGRDTRDRTRMAINHKNGKEAITHYEMIKRYPGYSLIKLSLETGRTHQIRVHMSYLKHPVVGDTRYTDREHTLGQTHEQMLHAATLGFIHPKTGEFMFFEAELPNYFQEILKRLEAMIEVTPI